MTAIIALSFLSGSLGGWIAGEIRVRRLAERLSVKHIVVESSSGRPVVEIGTRDERGFIELVDETGEAQVSLSAPIGETSPPGTNEQHGPAMMLTDPMTAARVFVGFERASEDYLGRSLMPKISVSKSPNQGISLFLTPGYFTPQMDMVDTTKTAVSLGIFFADRRPFIKFHDSSGRAAYSICIPPGLEPVVERLLNGQKPPEWINR